MTPFQPAISPRQQIKTVVGMVGYRPPDSGVALVIVRYPLDGFTTRPLRIGRWSGARIPALFAGPWTRRDDHARRDANGCACRRSNRKGAGGVPEIHFTICSQAIVIKYPYSGIFYS